MALGPISPFRAINELQCFNIFFALDTTFSLIINMALVIKDRAERRADPVQNVTVHILISESFIIGSFSDVGNESFLILAGQLIENLDFLNSK